MNEPQQGWAKSFGKARELIFDLNNKPIPAVGRWYFCARDPHKIILDQQQALDRCRGTLQCLMETLPAEDMNRKNIAELLDLIQLTK